MSPQSNTYTIHRLLQECSTALREQIAAQWRAPSALIEDLIEALPDGHRLFHLINDCGREERWTLFDVLDQGCLAPRDLYPRRLDNEGERIPFDLHQLRQRGLLFCVNASAQSDAPALVIPQDLQGSIHQYREQVLLLKLQAIMREMETHSRSHPPVRLPPHIQPHYALSHLVASGDPEGFRLPLSRALGIPEYFPSTLKSTLKQLLHEFYLLLLPQLGRLRPDRLYNIEDIVRLAMTLAGLLSHHHSRDLDAELCDDERRPFASPNVQLSGARRPLWRSFMVLFMEQFLTPVGGTWTADDERFMVYPEGFQRLDLEVRPSRWMRHILRDMVRGDIG